MFLLTRPSESQVRRFLSDQKDSPFSYPGVGASAGDVPKGYNVDRNRIQLGCGEVTWQRAIEGIRSWRMFSIPWLRLCWPTAPIQVGTEVAILVSHLGFYSLNACRIVYVVEEEDPITRFGFAYGTLAEHAESGEERFTVEWNRDNNEVWYDILAFSRPRQMFAKLGYPFARSLQNRFARDSKLAMCQAVVDH